MADKFHMHELMKVTGVIHSDRRGQCIGGAISILAIAGAIYIAKDQPMVAAALVGLPVLGIIKTLRNGTTQQPVDEQIRK